MFWICTVYVVLACVSTACFKLLLLRISWLRRQFCKVSYNYTMAQILSGKDTARWVDVHMLTSQWWSLLTVHLIKIISDVFNWAHMSLSPHIAVFDLVWLSDYWWLTVNMISALKSLGLCRWNSTYWAFKSKYIKSKQWCRAKPHMGPVRVRVRVMASISLFNTEQTGRLLSTLALWPSAALWPCTLCSDPRQSVV